MPLEVFKSIFSLVEGCNVIIDNHVCRFHYRFTAILLFVFSVLLSCRQYFGDPIDCLVANSKTSVESEALDTYCWIFSTFTVSKDLDGKMGQDIIFPGVGSGIPNDENVIRQKYYQWVPLVLLFQAMMFYLPRYIWILLENGHLGQVAHNLNGSISDPEWTKKRRQDIAGYIAVWKLNQQKGYALKFAFCELLNFVNVVSQLCTLEHFFGGQFFSYGHDLFKSLYSANVDATNAIFVRVFPKVAKCSFKFYGPSGSIQNLEALCILPLNIFNEKIFGFIFFWFVLVAIISFFALLYRVLFLETRVRFQMLSKRFAKDMSANRVNFICSQFDYGDCFFLDQLSKNMNPYFFDQLIKEIVKKMETLVATIDDEGSVWMQYSDDEGNGYTKIESNRLGNMRKSFASELYNVGKANDKAVQEVV